MNAHIYDKFDTMRFKMVAKLCEGSVLDIGCRDGEFKKYLPDNLYTGIDYNPQNLDVQYGDVYNLSYLDNTFDTVTLLEVMEHLENPIKALKEIRRVVKKRLIISMPNPWAMNQLASLICNNRNIINSDHINLFGDGEIISLCKRAGFSIITPMRFYTNIPGINWLVPIKTVFGLWNIYRIEV